MAAPGALLAVSTPASAADSSVICESSGNHYCIGAPNLVLYDPVVETVSGRYINDQAEDGGVRLQLNAATSLCVAAANDGVDVVLHPCSGGEGIIWFQEESPNGNRFESREFSGKFLSGASSENSQYQLKDLGANGWEQQFTISGV
ncbi:MAG TPA: hypothetical protein VGM53_30060 [Streptosporangiaceae bacterium]|jgi:hypothetical protein